MEHLVAGEHVFVYRRGGTVVALNNDSTPAKVRLAPMPLHTDALGVCSAPTADASGVTIEIPARSGCVF
jgi:hypothetical protein